MPDPGATKLLRLSGEGLSGVKWRPTRFTGDMVHRYACSLCGVIPGRAHLLPCGHTLCETCKGAIVQGGTGGVCPFDEERFDDEECNKILLPARKIDTLKAHCWNECHGCQFTGTLPDVLAHYEEDCFYHTVECPRCGDSVLHVGLATHYSAGCHATNMTSGQNCELPRERGVFGLDDVNAALEEFKELLREPYHNQLPALQSKMNEITEQVSTQSCLLEEIGETFRRMSSDEAGGDSGNRMPWHLEERHILRRLNVLATDTLARVQQADAPLAFARTPTISCLAVRGPQWNCVPAIGRSFRPTHGTDEAQVVTYEFFVSSMDEIPKLFPSGRCVLGEVTLWHSEYLYFTMALIIKNEEDRMEISFRFGATVGSESPPRSVFKVAILKKERSPHVLQNVNEADVRSDGFVWQQTFWSSLSEIRKNHLLEDGSMFVSVFIVV